MKIIQKLAIGENKTGQLVISGTSADQQWIGLCVDQTGQLLIDKLHPSCKLHDSSKSTVHSVGSAISPGTILETPNNVLYLSEAPREGRVSDRIRIEFKKPHGRQHKSSQPTGEATPSTDTIGSFLKPSRPMTSPQASPARKPKTSTATKRPMQTIVVQEPRKVSRTQKPSNPPPRAQAPKPSQIRTAQKPKPRVQTKPSQSRTAQKPKPRVQTKPNRDVDAKRPLRTPARPTVDDEESPGWGAGWFLLVLFVAALVAAFWWYREFSTLAPNAVITLDPGSYLKPNPGAPPQSAP